MQEALLRRNADTRIFGVVTMSGWRSWPFQLRNVVFTPLKAATSNSGLCMYALRSAYLFDLVREAASPTTRTASHAS